MREFAPARVFLTPPFAGDLCGRPGFVRSHFVGPGFVRVGIVRAGIVRAGFVRAGIVRAGIVRAGIVESERFVEARVCRKVVFVGVQGFSGGGFLRGARFVEVGVSRGPGFLGGPVWPAVAACRCWWFSGGDEGREFVEERSFRADRVGPNCVRRGLGLSGLGLPGTGFVGPRSTEDWVRRASVYRGLGLPGTESCRGLGLADRALDEP
jgi:hypothetical protein